MQDQTTVSAVELPLDARFVVAILATWDGIAPVSEFVEALSRHGSLGQGEAALLHDLADARLLPQARGHAPIVESLLATCGWSSERADAALDAAAGAGFVAKRGAS